MMQCCGDQGAFSLSRIKPIEDRKSKFVDHWARKVAGWIRELQSSLRLGVTRAEVSGNEKNVAHSGLVELVQQTQLVDSVIDRSNAISNLAVNLQLLFAVAQAVELDFHLVIQYSQ